MKLVKESLNEFKQGGDPYRKMGIGSEALVDKWFKDQGYFLRDTEYVIDNLDVKIKKDFILADWGGFGHPQHFPQTQNIPDNLIIPGTLGLQNCEGLTNLPNNLYVGGNVQISGCDKLINIPDSLKKINGDLILNSLNSLNSLPDYLDVKGHIQFIECPNLTSLPKRLIVGKTLAFHDCKGLTNLPNNLRVHSLDISNTSITELPDNLYIEHDLRFETIKTRRELTKNKNIYIGGKIYRKKL
jgi:hypothetical protein